MATSIITENMTSNSIITSRISSASITVNANDVNYAQVDISKNGYRPIAVSGYFKNGSNTRTCLCYEYWFEDGTFGFHNSQIARAYFRNVGSAAATFTVDFIVTYVKE